MRHDYEVDMILLGCWATVLLGALIWFVVWLSLWEIFS
jgi:hypothetical protein